jgi:hypothetical protein
MPALPPLSGSIISGFVEMMIGVKLDANSGLSGVAPRADDLARPPWDEFLI